MAVAERRQAILAVAVPLLISRGAAVTTAEVARAAGIAEGTIFRAFPDKSALIFEAAKATMDPARICAAMRAIDASRAMEWRLAEAAGLLRDYFSQVTAIGESLRAVSMPGAAQRRDVGRVIRESSAAISAALAAVFECHRMALRVPPATAVAAFRGLVFASAHPLLPPRERLAAEAVVGILLSGVAKTES